MKFTRKKLLILAALVCGIPLALLGVAVLGYQDLQVISTPGNPASGFVRFFANSSGLGCLTSSGGNCLTAAPSGSAGGDLSGTYPNPGVAKVNGASVPASQTCLGSNVSSQLVTGTCSGGSGALTQISQQTLGMAAATVSFTSISGAYTNLVLALTARSSRSNGFDQIVMQLNSDSTAGDYEEQFITASGGSPTGGTQNNNFIGAIAGATSLANAPGSVSVQINNYTNTTFMKFWQGLSGYINGAALTNIAYGTQTGIWNQTSAITQIDLTLQTGANFLTGSVFTLYGMQ